MKQVSKPVEHAVFKYKRREKPVKAKNETTAVACVEHGGSSERGVCCDAEAVGVLQNSSPFPFNEG
jgi:hypothetical protein